MKTIILDLPIPINVTKAVSRNCLLKYSSSNEFYNNPCNENLLTSLPIRIISEIKSSELNINKRL